MSDKKDARIAELEAERNDLARQLGEEISARMSADKKIAAIIATCEYDGMARTLRELEVLIIEAARQLRDRINAAKLKLDYETNVALALLDRQLNDLDAMRAVRVNAKPDGVPPKK